MFWSGGTVAWCLLTQWSWIISCSPLWRLSERSHWRLWLCSFCSALKIKEMCRIPVSYTPSLPSLCMLVSHLLKEIENKRVMKKIQLKFSLKALCVTLKGIYWQWMEQQTHMYVFSDVNSLKINNLRVYMLRNKHLYLHKEQVYL